MRYLIDTNIVIALTVQDDRTVGRMLNIHRRDSGISTVVLHEL
jgi:predicted nucleic acid-binding protein